MKPGTKWTIIIGGVLTFLGPLLGLLGTVIGMMGSFHTLGASGVADPEKLSSNISVTLISTGMGIIVGIVGLLTASIGLAIWFFTREQQNPSPLPHKN